MMAPAQSSRPDQMPGDVLTYLYHHLFLPPKLPTADDASQKNAVALLDFVKQSLERFLPGRRDEKTVRACLSMLKSLQASRSPQGYLKDACVRDILKGLSAQGTLLQTRLNHTEKLTHVPQLP